LPSVENFAYVSTPGWAVSRVAVPPFTDVVHRSPPYVNTTRSPKTSGKRSSFVCADMADAAKRHTTTTKNNRFNI